MFMYFKNCKSLGELAECINDMYGEVEDTEQADDLSRSIAWDSLPTFGSSVPLRDTSEVLSYDDTHLMIQGDYRLGDAVLVIQR